jgi:NADH:ubiquinone oxidoreductase subunit C
MVDKIEQKNKKNGMWSDGTIQWAGCKYEHSGEISLLVHIIILNNRVCHVHKMWNNADWEENEQI